MLAVTDGAGMLETSPRCRPLRKSAATPVAWRHISAAIGLTNAFYHYDFSGNIVNGSNNQTKLAKYTYGPRRGGAEGGKIRFPISVQYKEMDGATG